MKRRFLSVLLSLCLALGLLPTAAFAQDTSNYVTQGDSITGLADGEQAFPEMLAEIGGSGGEEQPEPQVEQLWVNGENILEATDYTVQCGSGTAAYDPADNTLTLDNTEITETYTYEEYGEYYSIKFTSGVYVEGDLTIVLEGDNAIPGNMDYGIYTVGDAEIQGDSLLVTGAADDGLYCRGSLEITDCSVEVSGSSVGIYGKSLAVSDSSVTIADVDTGISTGGVNIQNSFVDVTATGFALDNGQVIADSLENSVESGAVTLISTEGTAVFANNLTITGGTVTIEGHRYYGIMSMGPIVISGTPTVTVFGEMGGIWDITSSLIAVNGVSYVSEQTKECKIEDGEVVSGLRRSMVFVNGVGLNDIDTNVICGGGTAVYDPAAKTLTLTNVAITEGYIEHGETTGIYAEDDLTIILNGTNTIHDVDYGIQCNGDLTIQGDGSLDIRARYVGLGAYITCIQSGTIDIEAADPMTDYFSGISCESITIAGGTINVSIGDDIADCNGLSANYVITITGGNLTITGGNMESFDGVTITGTPTISVTSKEGYRGIDCWYDYIEVNDLLYSCTGNEVKIESGVVTSGLRENCVWVDGVKLNGQTATTSCGSGTAAYDPEENTLTLTDATISSGHIFNGYEDCGIFTDESLTIDLVGNNTIQGDGMDYAIYSSGSESDVTIRGSGSLSVRVQNCGIYTAGDLSIRGGTVDISAESGASWAYGVKCAALEIRGDSSNVTVRSGNTAVQTTYGMTITGGTVEVDGAVVGIHVIGGALTVTGGSLTAIGGTLCGVLSKFSDLVLEGGTVTAIGREEGSYGIVAPGLTMKQGSTLTVSGAQAAIRLMNTAPDLPEGYLPDGYSVRKVDYQGQGGDTWSLYTIARKGATLTYDPNTATGTLTGAATSVTLMEYAVDEGDDDDDKDDDRDTGSTTESERNPDGSLTTTVTKPDGTTVETTRNPDGSKEVVETKKDGTVVTTATDKSGNETKTTENPDGTSVVSVTRTDGSTSATTVDEDGLSVTVAALSDSAAAQTGTVSLPMPAVTAASDLKSAPAVTLDLPADTAVKVEIPVENMTAGTVAVLVKADGTSEIVRTSVATADGVVLTLSAGETVKIVDNTKTFADVSDTFWGADAVAFASSRELFNGTSATDFSPNAAMDRAMIVTVLARLDGVDTTAGSAWYEAGVQWAVSSGISDGSGLDQNLTREQLATMLYRYAQYKGCDVSVGENTNILSYSDVSSVSGYAMEAMQWACGAGIIGGKDGLLDPAGNATRAEVATMLMRFVALL